MMKTLKLGKSKLRKNTYSAPNLQHQGMDQDSPPTTNYFHHHPNKKISTSSTDSHDVSVHFNSAGNSNIFRNTTFSHRRNRNRILTSSIGSEDGTIVFDVPTRNSYTAEPAPRELPNIIITSQDDKARVKSNGEELDHMEQAVTRHISTSDNSAASCSSLKSQDESPESFQTFASMPNMFPAHNDYLRNITDPKSDDSRMRRKFLKHFKELRDDEIVLNSYSCALLSDILLQGTLYITSHRFAFHSKIFGYQTIKLFPLSEVIKIKKQKTAKIIPNAIGVYTNKKKYIFGSLIARNVTFKLMCHVLKTSMLEEEEDDDSCTGSGDNNMIMNSTESASIGSESEHSDEDDEEDGVTDTVRRMSRVTTADQLAAKKRSHLGENRAGSRGFLHGVWATLFENNKPVKVPILLLISLALLVFLSISATFLLYRLHQVQRIAGFHDPLSLHHNWDAKDLYRLQELRHQEAMKRLQSSLEVHIIQLNQVRSALEMLVRNIPKMTEDSKQYEKMTLTPMKQPSNDNTKLR